MFHSPIYLKPYDLKLNQEVGIERHESMPCLKGRVIQITKIGQVKIETEKEHLWFSKYGHPIKNTNSGYRIVDAVLFEERRQNAIKKELEDRKNLSNEIINLLPRLKSWQLKYILRDVQKEAKNNV